MWTSTVVFTGAHKLPDRPMWELPTKAGQQRHQACPQARSLCADLQASSVEAVHCYALEMLCHNALRSMWTLASYGPQLFHFCTILPADSRGSTVLFLKQCWHQRMHTKVSNTAYSCCCSVDRVESTLAEYFGSQHAEQIVSRHIVCWRSTADWDS